MQRRCGLDFPPGPVERGGMNDSDIIIVGGGMVGLSLAVALGQAGLSIAVVDREDPAKVVDAAFDGRTSAIADASVRMLESIGLWRHVAAAQPIQDIRVSDGDSPLFLHYDHREIGDRPFGQMVENRVFRQALQARLNELPGVVLHAPAAVTGVERGAGRVTVRLAGGAVLTAPLCVAADGRQSALREAAGIQTTAWSYDQVGVVCTVAHDLPHHGVAQERFLPAGPFAILPMTGNRCSLVWTERKDLAPAMLALDDTGFNAEIACRFGDYLGAVRAVGPRWSYPLSLHLAERYVDSRLVLIGDAAHGIHPIAGQGLNLGLRDVAALAEVLVESARIGLDLGQADVLARYQRWRRFDTVLLAGVTDVLNRLFSNDIAPVQTVRDLGLATVNKLPPLKRFLMRHAMGSVGELPRLLRGEAL